LITDPSAPAGLVASVKRALERPTRCPVALHLRHPGASDRELVDLAHELRRITADAGALLMINRRADVALASGADGVHLPESGLEVDSIRALGPTLLVGVSRHDAEGLRTAAGADYVFLSPVHGVPGKGSPLGPARFDALARESPAKVIALGGMTPENFSELRHAYGVGVIRSVLHSSDPSKEMQAMDLALAESG
jgi:thiamine-phosphate pyrophosphorylase